MPRGSSGGRSSGRAPSRAAVRNPPQKAGSASPPAIAQAVGKFVGSIVTSITEGLGFGAGNAIGHRVMEAVLGPRSFKVEHVDSPAPKAPPVNAALRSDACNSRSKAFQDCINNFGSDISRCQFYLDMLNQCRRGSGAVVSA